jgi:hypothetical protein
MDAAQCAGVCPAPAAWSLPDQASQLLAQQVPLALALALALAQAAARWQPATALLVRLDLVQLALVVQLLVLESLVPPLAARPVVQHAQPAALSVHRAASRVHWAGPRT